MICGLPMYDRPETARANDQWWALIRDSLRDFGIQAPDRLSRDLDPWALWQDENLVLAQTCGLPYRTRLHGHVALIATPVYDLPCTDGHYFSTIVVRADDPRETPAAFAAARLALNEYGSQSGWAAAHGWARTHQIDFGAHLQTGAHVSSARAVAEGRADLAALDALTWTMIQKWDGFAKNLRALDRTDPTPTLPFIAALGQDAAATRKALTQATDALPGEMRACLGLRGITMLAASDYLAIPNPPPGP